MREEWRRSRHAGAPDAVEKPVEHDVHVRRFAFSAFPLVAVAFLGLPDDVATGASDVLRLVFGLVLGIEIDIVDLVAAVADPRPIARPGEKLPVRAPRRRPVPFPVPRQVVRLFAARRRNDPHVAVVVGVHELRGEVARVGAPGDGADGEGLGAQFRLQVLQRHHLQAAALVRTGEARAVRREVQPDADRVVGNQRFRRERRILPPRQGRVRAARATDVRAVAAVHQIVQAGPVRRERARRHARETPLRHETRRLHDGVHRVQPPADRKRRLHAVRAEREVAFPFRVPGGCVVATAAKGRPRLVAARTQRDAHGLAETDGWNAASLPKETTSRSEPSASTCSRTPTTGDPGRLPR